MIDIENQVFDRISKAVKKEFPTANMSSEEIIAPSEMPCVTIVEADNYTVAETLDSSNEENHAYVMHEVNVYANGAFKKAECKAIYSIVDNEYRKMGFRRMSKPFTASNDPTVARMMGRYVGIVGADDTIYGGY